jgi:hypothetical protein
MRAPEVLMTVTNPPVPAKQTDRRWHGAPPEG